MLPPGGALSLLPVLWLGRAAALRLARPGTADVSSFVSDDRLLCTEGAPRVTEGALALRKAGPRGSLYIAAQAANMTCEALGYRLAAGSDSCYPEVHLFVRGEGDQPEVAAAEAAALRGFAARYSLDPGQAALLAACACHPQSSAAQAEKGRCPELDALTGAWVHHDPSEEGEPELMCDEGPILDATFALATLKSTGQLPMHFHDQVAATSCRSLGFPVVFPPQDHCFLRMHIWTRTELSGDKGAGAAQQVEGALFGGEFKRWAEKQGLNSWVLNSKPGCHCQPGSSVRASVGRVCDMPEMHSPISDWWHP